MSAIAALEQLQPTREAVLAKALLKKVGKPACLQHRFRNNTRRCLIDISTRSRMMDSTSRPT